MSLVKLSGIKASAAPGARHTERAYLEDRRHPVNDQNPGLRGGSSADMTRRQFGFM